MKKFESFSSPKMKPTIIDKRWCFYSCVDPT